METVSIASATPPPAAAKPQIPSASALFRQVSARVDTGVNVLANADAGGVWGKPEATSYVGHMREAFADAATAFGAAKAALQPQQRELLEGAGLGRALESAAQYVRREADGVGLIANYNTPGSSLFGGTTAVSLALILDDFADDTRRAADLLAK